MKIRDLGALEATGLLGTSQLEIVTWEQDGTWHYLPGCQKGAREKRASLAETLKNPCEKCSQIGMLDVPSRTRQSVSAETVHTLQKQLKKLIALEPADALENYEKFLLLKAWGGGSGKPKLTGTITPNTREYWYAQEMVADIYKDGAVQPYIDESIQETLRAAAAFDQKPLKEAFAQAALPWRKTYTLASANKKIDKAHKEAIRTLTNSDEMWMVSLRAFDTQALRVEDYYQSKARHLESRSLVIMPAAALEYVRSLGAKGEAYKINWSEKVTETATTLYQDGTYPTLKEAIKAAKALEK